jgi:RHS repeat-associated protein
MTRKNTGIRLAIKIFALLLTGLFFATAAWARNLEVNVETGKGRALSDLIVYAFTESGSYTGIKSTTEENGTAIFDSDDFEAGTYKYRVDYLGNRFWSQVVSLPETSTVGVVIDEETAEVTVTTGAGPVQGAKVYLFTGSGSYLSLYGNTDAGGKVSFDLPVGRDFKFRADISGNHYWSDVTTILAGGPNQVPVDAGGGLFQMTVEKGPGIPMEGINTYLFNTSGTYLGLSQVTDSSGVVGFNVPEGNYKVRADYLGYRFWSQETWVSEDTSITLAIVHQDVVITVQGMYQGTPEALEGRNVYLFTPSGSYLSRYRVTDASGQVTFNLPERAYKVRADYLGRKFWSGDFTWQITTVDIPMADAEITVTGSGQPLEEIKVYAFSSYGSYLSLNDTTDANGRATFRLPAGTYKFRADYQGSQYWSGEETLTADQVNPIAISTGGGTFTLTVLKGAANPLVGINCYVFSEAGSYLGMSATTDGNGQVSFALADGTYKFRVDYLGNRFWTPVYTVPTTLSDDFTIAHQDATITVQGMYQGTPEALEGLKVYLFTPAGSYLSQYQVTDGNGQVTFNLPERAYKVRADYLGQKFWSGDFTWQNTTVDIPMADAQITVTGSGQPLEGIKVYAFSSSGSYLSLNDTTDANGRATFRLPAGTYKFRADYQGSQYWSGEETLLADQINPIEISTGGGTFTLTVLKGAANPLVSVKCYVFSEGGSYLGMSATTDTNGQVSFALADGIYKFRVDYLGNQFWTPVYTLPTTLSDDFIIAHQDIVITVEGTYQGAPEPKVGLNVYLFTPSGSYLSQYEITDGSGQVTFNLPEQAYKVRTDYLGQQFWSGEFTWQDTTVNIPQGMARVHVKRGTTDVQGARVYLFTESGSYLGWYEVTDSSGMAEFLLPARTFKFRADEGGDQVWSDPVAITIDQVNDVDLNLGAVPPAVSISADPATIDMGESSTLSWNSTDADTVTIDKGIGEVDLTGSTNVSPTETTTYTITATGPGGTATDSAMVTVISAPNDVDYGLDTDEQQGGGGLVGETVRVLNGNALDIRSDLRFSSPHRLGLVFRAVYNSRSTVTGGSGYGWSHTYGAALNPSFEHNGTTYLKVVDGTGRARYFLEGSPGEYEGAFKERTHVKLESGEYVWYRLDGSQYGFDGSGRLLCIDDEKGNRLEVSYDGQGRPWTVIDTASGRTLTFAYNAGSGLLESITGPLTSAVTDGVWITYGYDGNSNLTSVTYADGSGFSYSYTDPNDIHNMTEKRDKENHLLKTWAYDALDRGINNFCVQGKGVSVSYVSESRVDVTDAYNTLRAYTLGMLDGRKRVTAMTGIGSAPYSVGNAIRWVYDEEMRLIEVEYAGGTINQYQDYDERGNPGTVTLAVGTPEERTFTYTYHPDMNVPLSRTEVSVLGTGNKVSIWDYDNDYNAAPNEDPTGLLCRIIEQGFTKDTGTNIIPYEYITTFTYNGKGQVLSIDGPLPGNGDTTALSYDTPTGDLVSITRPLIGNTNFSNYDAAGQVGRVTDVNGQSKDFSYDGRGRITTITNNADGSSTGIAYNMAGQPVSRTDEDGVLRGFNYDATYGRLIRTTDHEGNYIAYDYDTQGNRIEKSYHDPSDTRTNWKRYSHQQPDIPGKLWKEINNDGTFTEYGYDGKGNVNSVTDPNGHNTGYLYDPLNRLAEVSQPGNLITSYFYDIHGNLTSVIDAEEHETIYQYDDMGRVVSTTSPDTGTVTYVYDEAGNLVSKTDAKGITVAYAYDTLNRLTAVHFPDSTQDITYTYDVGTYGKGRRTGMTDPSGSMTFTYDARGRLVEKTSTINGYSYSVSKSFTLGGRISSVTYPTGRTMDYDRSGCACRVDMVSSTYGGDTTILVDNLSYRPFGIANGMNAGSGGTVANTFDQSGRLIVANPGQPKEQTYTYDANGNLTSIQAPSIPWHNRIFTYDALNRLTGAEGPYGTIDYTYDGVGNRLTRVENTQTETYSYITGTNLLQDVTGTETVTYSHDANGNITGIGDKVLTYNQNNRLIRVEEDGDILGEYTYNGLAQRVIKEVDGVTTVFHYDFNGNIVGESDLDGNFITEYLYRGNGRVAKVDVGTSTMSYYLNDRLGTPLLMTNETNTVIWEGVYKPFGEADVNPNSSVVNNHRFAGQYYDQETGLHYNYHRYYMPQTGRYLTADPIGLIRGINLYPYVLNNPIMFIDPFGLCENGGGTWLTHLWIFLNPPFEVRFKQAAEYMKNAIERSDLEEVVTAGPTHPFKWHETAIYYVIVVPTQFVRYSLGGAPPDPRPWEGNH